MARRLDGGGRGDGMGPAVEQGLQGWASGGNRSSITISKQQQQSEQTQGASSPAAALRSSVLLKGRNGGEGHLQQQRDAADERVASIDRLAALLEARVPKGGVMR